MTATGLNKDEFEVISEKVTYRLAQRPGSYVVTKYVRPVLKLRETGKLVSIPAPEGVIKGSRADVSFLAGVVVDKFSYHQPLYRIHRKLADQGFKLSRPWLTQLMQQTIEALMPIFDAQFDSIRLSRVKCMDETPIKAGVASPGKMKAAYFWPIYGELDEICFKFYPDRSAKNVEDALGLSPPDGAVLLTDGYSTYKKYAKKVGLTHAQCWACTRRKFFESQNIEPERAKQALDMIGELYVIEEQLREKERTSEVKKAIRQREAKPLVNKFFTWVQKQFDSQGLLPSSPLTTALSYTRERREGLEAYLNDPDVPIDTNHLERALRAIPMGRRNWLFCWTETGAEHVGVVQSLLTTCRLHDIDPYEYRVDVLQRVKNHPPLQMGELTPRSWKELFAQNPKRSVLHLIDQMRKKSRVTQLIERHSVIGYFETPKHGHKGPGIRRLYEGRLVAEIGDEVRRLDQGDAWFETGHDPIIGRNIAPHSGFVRAMVLPVALHGKSTFIPWDETEAAKPRGTLRTEYFDRIVHC